MKFNINNFLNISSQSSKIVDFQDLPTNARSAATTDPFCLIFTISKSFQMMYCMTLHLKGVSKRPQVKVDFSTLTQ